MVGAFSSPAPQRACTPERVAYKDWESEPLGAVTVTEGVLTPTPTKSQKLRQRFLYPDFRSFHHYLPTG